MKTWPLLILLAAPTLAQSPFKATEAATASEYWFDRAEITRYELTQMRYGEIRSGDSVLIYVTEPFLRDKQVKHEFGPGDEAVPVLKLNRIRSFTTGIYDYRLMASIFHPILEESSDPIGLKIAMSSTEWCGLSFQQINRRNDALEIELRSYFQKEGDQNLTLPNVWTEDELWLRLRIDPASLPIGEFRAMPEVFYQRLAHLEPVAHAVTASFTEDKGGNLSAYRLFYPALDRALEITFETDYPHRILGWTETVGNELFSRGEATHTERLYYWELNQRKDLPYRDQLRLPKH